MKNKTMNSGTALWTEAKQVIPGGNQLLSKRAEMFLPDQWPAYYERAKGCEIWDLDGQHYYDMSIMGIGTCVLGYAHNDVTEAVINAVSNGNMSTFNCYEEVSLAKKLIDLHPWASSARFARTGGEGCTVAVRIARAFTGKDKVAFCGYHGWHDWYLASNIQDSDNLKGLLLPGLEPSGVPQGLAGTAYTFQDGDIDRLKAILEENKGEMAAVMMEVFRHALPNKAFIEEVRSLCDQEGVVLIFDEVSSGFRLNTGGAHLTCDVHPDICVLGKTMGSGHPISAIIGKKEVMDAAQQSFISSSYWTERTGFVAALKTIEVYERERVAEQIAKTGQYLKSQLTHIFDEVGINISIVGVDSIVILAIKEDDPLLVKSIITQEMLKKGFLASNIIYVSIAHTPDIVDQYLSAMKDVLKRIKSAIDDASLESLLEGPVCHSGFKRLN